MSHVGVKRFGAREREQHGTQHGKRGESMLRHETERVQGVERAQDGRMLDDPVNARRGQREEPQHHDRPEQRAYGRGAVALEQEQCDQHPYGYGQDVRLESGSAHLEPLDRREYRDGRRQHRITIEERRAEQAHQQDRRKRAPQPFHGR